MPLTATQQLELVSLIQQKLKPGDKDQTAATQAWLRIFVHTMTDEHQEDVYDDLLGRTIEEQSKLRDQSDAHYTDVLGILNDKKRIA